MIFFKKYILMLWAILALLAVMGCETPEGGSSVPWSQPEAWEGQVVPGLPDRYE